MRDKSKTKGTNKQNQPGTSCKTETESGQIDCFGMPDERDQVWHFPVKIVTELKKLSEI